MAVPLAPPVLLQWQVAREQRLRRSVSYVFEARAFDWYLQEFVADDHDIKDDEIARLPDLLSLEKGNNAVLGLPVTVPGTQVRSWLLWRKSNSSIVLSYALPRCCIAPHHCICATHRCVAALQPMVVEERRPSLLQSVQVLEFVLCACCG